MPWLKNQLEKQGNVICLDFPIGVGNQCYENWSKELNKYKNQINKESIFIGRSIGPIFAIKYVLENNLYINKLISISGFNNYFVDGGDFDKVNESMFVDNLKSFQKHCENSICIISENDPYVNLETLKDFAEKISALTINIKDGGHFNSDSGYGEKFEELLKIIYN